MNWMILTFLLSAGGPDFSDRGATDFCQLGSGPCEEAHAGRGCDWPECCNSVCALIPECCDEQWDDLCAFAATELCEAPPPCVQSIGDCHGANKTPGCTDDLCCATVCALDGYCCSYEWDEICVHAADRFCDQSACVIDILTPTIVEADECEEPLNDGCNDDPPTFSTIQCGDVVSGRIDAWLRRDTDWYSLELTEPTVLTWTVWSEFPSEIAVMDGTCADGFAAIEIAFGGECIAQTVTITAGPGTVYLVIAPGMPDIPLFTGLPCREDPEFFYAKYGRRYTFTVTCDG